MIWQTCSVWHAVTLRCFFTDCHGTAATAMRYTAPAERPANRRGPRSSCRPMARAPDSGPRTNGAARLALGRAHVSYLVHPAAPLLAAEPDVITQIRVTYVEEFYDIGYQIISNRVTGGWDRKYDTSSAKL